MLYELVAEFIGTFILVAVILVSGEAIPIGAALATGIFLTSKISGGHLNPAVSTIFFAKGDLTTTKYFGYVLFQILGALAALGFAKAK
jgi:aquaporin Z